jgi:5-methylcytosine-specific restriction endonuclease McrA
MYKDKENRNAANRRCYAKKREYYQQRNKEKREKRREVIFESLGNKCCLCGSTDRMEIDHINPSLKTSRQSILSYGLEKSLGEIDNLRLLCYNHHRIWSTAQRKAAYRLLYALPVEDQQRLVSNEIDTESL